MTWLLDRILLRELRVCVRDIFDVFNSPPSVLKIVYTSRQFQLHGEDFDDSFLFIGPSIIERKHDPAFPLERLRGRIAYISLGTVANASIGFYRLCFSALAGVKATAVMSVGRRIDMKRRGAIPANFLVFDHVPQLEVLKRADIYVTPAGMNCISEGLYDSVPLVIN
jgi:MGT family glycosyltransferase